MKTNDTMSSAGAWMLEHGHKTLLALTGGRWPKTIGGMQTVDLTTIGRTSGERRTKPLTTPIHDDDRIVLVASKGGHSIDPDWYKNLVANPDVEITIDGRTLPMRARTAAGDERAELWAAITKRYKGYAGYQRNTEREIPVVVCEPRPA
jgi:deazaflavin-dependent oxidoreductase (nitroreductase family)